MNKISILSFILIILLSLGACGNEKNKNSSSDKKQIKNEVTEKNKNYETGIEKGNKIPDFNLTNLLGGTQSINDYKGKLILLNFWATWCPPCRHEMPSMENLYKNKNNRNFEILAVSVDRDSTNKVSDFIIKNNYSFPVFHDTKGSVADKFLITSIPQTYIINEEGIILEKITGAFDWEKLDIDAYIKGD